jgi:hypothetical protein
MNIKSFHELAIVAFFLNLILNAIQDNDKRENGHETNNVALESYNNLTGKSLLFVIPALHIYSTL